MTPEARRGWRWAALAGIAVMGVIGLSFVGGSPIYIAKGVEGRIVDAETGQPLAGVVVIAEWPKRGGFLHPTTLGFFAVQEAVSDADGRYAIPGWGPQLRWRGTPQNGRPELRFFKAGYRGSALTNVFPGSPWDIELRSDWDGKMISLRPRPDEPPPRGQLWDQTVQDFSGHLGVLERMGVDLRRVLPSATAAIDRAKASPPARGLRQTEGAE